MTPTFLIAVLAGATTVGGLVLLAMAIMGWAPEGRPRRRPLVRWRSARPAATSARGARARRRAAVGAAVGVLLWLVTGWLVAVVVVPLAAAGLPPLLGRTDTDAASRKLEGLEEWTRHLAGVLDVGVGLEQAIAVNLRSTPSSIRPAVQALVARLSARWPTEAALRAFADDLDDATGDLVAASLVLGAQRRGSGLTRVLDGLASTVADEVRMRRQVEADRAKPRTTARAVTLITLAVLALLSFNTSYIAPYGTAAGQVVLLLLVGLYTAALAWMHVMARGRTAPRLLRAVGRSPGATPSPTPAVPVSAEVG